MKILPSLIALALLAAACTPDGPQSELLDGDNLMVLAGATLIDGTASAPLPNSVIVIEGERILRIGLVGDFRYGDGVTVEDLSGKFILPGFVDVHVHPRLGAEADTMRMLLEFGITSIRIPGVGFDGHDTLGLELRNKIEMGKMIGPRITTGGKIIEGPTKSFPDDVEVHSADEMRAEVRRQADLEVDLVKLYWNTSPEFVRAAIDEAHGRGLQVLGHLRATSWTEAARAGIDGLLHSAADGPFWELVPPEQREGLRALTGRRKYARFAALIEALVNNGVAVDPTLVIMQTLYFGDDLRILERLEPDLASPNILESWGEGWQEGNPVLVDNPQELTFGKGVFSIAREIVRRFHEGGVHLAVGTDVGMPWITPGVSFHREMELLVEAGIAPADVLVMATRNGAETIRASNERGTIALGKLADLIVLGKSPIDDIRNTRSIEAVYKGGKFYRPNPDH